MNMFLARSPMMTAMKKMKWNLMISVITWTKIFLLDTGHFPTADSGPIAQVLTGVPDWMNMSQEDLNLALASLLS